MAEVYTEPTPSAFGPRPTDPGTPLPLDGDGTTTSRPFWYLRASVTTLLPPSDKRLSLSTATLMPGRPIPCHA